MSTAELGVSLAEMIRQDKVAIISCTGANLEEDLMNLVAHSHYERVPHYRDLRPEDERTLLDRGLNRVTDTCIPEKEEAFGKLQGHFELLWKKAEDEGQRKFPHEFMYELLRSKALEPDYQIDPAHSWILAAAEKKLAACGTWLGRQHIGQHIRLLLHPQGTECTNRALGHRVHGISGPLVS